MLQVCGSLLLMDVWAIAQTECRVRRVCRALDWDWGDAQWAMLHAVGACNALFVRATQLTFITQTNHTLLKVEQYETCRAN